MRTNVGRYMDLLIPVKDLALRLTVLMWIRRAHHSCPTLRGGEFDVVGL